MRYIPYVPTNPLGFLTAAALAAVALVNPHGAVGSVTYYNISLGLFGYFLFWGVLTATVRPVAEKVFVVPFILAVAAAGIETGLLLHGSNFIRPVDATRTVQLVLWIGFGLAVLAMGVCKPMHPDDMTN
jgi:hypothetical protein